MIQTFHQQEQVTFQYDNCVLMAEFLACVDFEKYICLN